MSGPSLLRKYLDDHDETQSAFADRAGVNGGALSTWLAGDRAPDLSSAHAVERATGGAVPTEAWDRKDCRPDPHQSKAS
jgi:DNA-binding transcriptional regulator YdaS (Cro superfamily)